MQELEGTVAVTLGRYLHFEADLYFHAPLLGMQPVAVALDAEGGALLLSQPASGSKYMQLNESRRMRSTETHYLDHPKLGLVVRIDPVEIPEHLVEAFDNLEEDIE